MPMYERDGARLEAPLKDKTRLGVLGWELEPTKGKKKQVKPTSTPNK